MSAYTLTETVQRLLTRAAGTSQFLDDLCQALTAEGGYAMAWAGRVRFDDRCSIEKVASAGERDGSLEGLREHLDPSWADNEPGRGPSGYAVRSRTPQTVNDIAAAESFPTWRVHALAHGYASATTLPLICRNEVVGVLGLFADTPHRFGSENMKALCALAGQVAQACCDLESREALQTGKPLVRAA